MPVPFRALFALAVLSRVAAAASVPAGAVYQESGGIVVMEAERTPSSLGSGSDRWEIREPGDANFVDGATNGGHLEFLGNSSNGGDPEAPLTYTFRIHEAGYYHLHLRARARLDGAPSDKNNDCYVKVAGLDGATFDDGPNAGNDHMDDAPLSTLEADTKMYGGAPNSWGWANLLDKGGSSNKRWPVYLFNANSTYRLTISGRSIKFNLDRIVFRKSTIADTSAKAASIPESSLEAGGTSTPAVTRIMVVDAETDRDIGELTEGTTLNLAIHGANLNLRVETSPPVIGSVKFGLDGHPGYRTDPAAPYSIGGDNIWDDYLPWTPAPGNHALTVTPFSNGGAAGAPVTVNFSVINQLPGGSPAANAGTDRVITLPAESTGLSGSGNDGGGSITAYRWDQTAGPSVATFSSRATAATTVSDLTVGAYRFRLTVTDDSGLTGFDDVEVTVAPAAGSLAVNAGPDQVVTLPSSSITLNGSAEDPDGRSDFRLWTQLSGPSKATRSGETSFNLTASDLVEGTYIFRLRLFDGSELVGADDVAVSVAAAGGDGISGFDPPVLHRQPGDQVRLTFQGDPGRSYTFQRSTTLAGWTNLQTLAAEPDGSVEFTDTDPPAGVAFYRLETP